MLHPVSGAPPINFRPLWELGADTIVWLATLPDDGPTAGFFHDRRAIQTFTIANGKITEIELIGDRARLRGILGDGSCRVLRRLLG
jgi:hypothetical protein